MVKLVKSFGKTRWFCRSFFYAIGIYVLLHKKTSQCIAAVRTKWYNVFIKGNNKIVRKECYTMAVKSANLYARIEPDVKEQAESILSALGIPASSAINMFYKQIILNRGLPFEVKIPAEKPVNVADLTEIELNAELEKGYADMTVGRTKPVKQAFTDIRKDYGI